MRRLLKLAAIALPAATLVGAVALLVYLQSAAFQELVRGKVIEELEKRFAVSVELEAIRVDWVRTAVHLRGLSFQDAQFPAPEPALELPAATIDFSLSGLLRPKAILDDVRLRGLVVRLLEDPNGRLNLVNMFRKPGGPPPELSKFIALGIRHWSLESGMLWFNDQPIHLISTQGGMELDVQFFADRQRYAGIMKLTGVDFRAGAVALAPVDLDIKFELLGNSIELPSLRVSTPALEMEQAGAIVDLVGFTYRFNGWVRARPAQFQQPDLAQEIRSGEFLARGVFSGSGGNFRYQGRLESKAFRWRDLRFQDFSTDFRLDRSSMLAENMSFGFEGGRVQGAGELAWSDELPSRFQLRAAGMRLTQLAPWLQSPALQVRGQAEAEVEVGWPGLNFSQITGQGLSRFGGDLVLPRPPLSPAAFPFEGVSPFQLAPQGVSFTGGQLNALDSEVALAGQVQFNGQFQIQAGVSAPQGQALLDFASLSPVWPEWMQERPVPVSGPVTSRLEVVGRGDGFRIQGDARLNQIQWQGESLGDLSFDYLLTPESVELRQVNLAGDPDRVQGRLLISLADAATGIESLQLQASRLAISRWAQLLNFESPLQGRLTGQLQAARTAAGSLQGRGRLDIAGARLLERKLDSVSADFTIQDDQINLSPLEVGLLKGRLAGAVRYQSDPVHFDVDLRGTELELGELPDWPAGARIAAPASVLLRASGDLTDYRLQASLLAPSAKIDGHELKSVQLDLIRPQPRAPDLQLRLSAGFMDHPLVVEGEIAAAAPHTFEARMALEQLPLGPYFGLLPAESRVALDGELTGKASVSGSLDNLQQLRGEAVFSKIRVAAESYQIHNQTPLTLEYAGRKLHLQPVRFSGRDTEFQVSGELDFQGQPNVVLKTEGFLNLLLLNPFLEGGSTLGTVRLETVLSGPVEDPRIVGDARLEKAFLQHPSLPTPLFDTSGRLRFTANQVSIDELTTRTIFGTLNAEGGVFLEGLRPARWLVNVYGSGLRIEYPEQVFSNLDLDVDFLRNDQSQLLSGVVYLRAAEYTEEISLPELLLRYSGGTTFNASVPGEEIVLDIAVEGYRTIQIDNNLAQITASGDFKIRGTLDNPVILGSLTVDEGKLFLEHNEYDITRGVINFKNPRRTRPEFSFEAATDVRDVSVNIILNGPIDQLKVSFRSEPPLPTPSIVSLLAVGQTQEELFGTEGGQERVGSLALFGAGALLSKSLGNRLQAQSSRLFGFDRVSIDPFLFGSERNPGARVTLGKQLGNRASVTYSTDLGSQTQGQIVVVEFKITDWLTAVGTGEQDGTLAIDFKLKKRF